jgi:hypothetical protein
MSNYLWRINDPVAPLWPETDSVKGHLKANISSFLKRFLHKSAIFNFTIKGLNRSIALNISESRLVPLKAELSNAKLSGLLKSQPSRE